MTRFSTKTLLLAAVLSALTTSAFAQAAAPTPWVLTPDMGYGYDKDGTLFFIGENGQLYMRSGPYLEGDGKFMFGPG
jgi:hypothetical protein